MLASLIALSLVLQDPTPTTQAPAQVGASVDASTPEQAIRTFILAMATKDAATLRAVTLPTDDLDFLLQGQAVPAEHLAQVKAQIAAMPVRVLKVGEEISLPGNRKYTAKAEDVTADRAVVMPEGVSFPANCRKVKGRWLVDASPIIVGLKASRPTAPKTVDITAIKDKISITLGKKIEVQFDRKENALSNVRIVEAPKDKATTVHLEFIDQEADLILITRNPFPKNLAFRAAGRRKGSKTYVETSIVPVFAGLAGIEAWREPIEELVLFDFKLIDAKP